MEYRYETGDCRKLLKEVPDSSVRLVVTSPPYNIGKPYGKYKDRIALNDWEELLRDVTREVVRILTPDGSFFLNLSPVPFGKGKEILPLPFIGYQIMKENGLYLRNMITWTFNNMQNCTNRLSGRYENILWGVKDIENYVFHLDDVRIPYITKNDKRLEGGAGRNPTDVWYFDRVNNMTKKKLNLSHPTIYPLPMIVRILKMSSDVGDTVLDPFAGSGTSLVAAKILKRNAIGFEIDGGYKEEAERRLATEGEMDASVFAELFTEAAKAEKFRKAQTDLTTVPETAERAGEEDTMLYQELLDFSRKRLDAFFSNVRIFENQFTWSDFNAACYRHMYAENPGEHPAAVKELKEEIPELKGMCKKCGDFFMPQRNESIPKYDVILGKQHEDLLMGFLAKKLNARIERGDLENRRYPDCAIYDEKGNIAAYFEVKFHGAPFISAKRFTDRYCYEGSATLDYKKIEKQLDIIKREIDVPVYYVHWIEYPCLKGVFYETAEQVEQYINRQHVEFERKKREGDEQKAKENRYYTKMYSPLLAMGSFEEMVEEFSAVLQREM